MGKPRDRNERERMSQDFRGCYATPINFVILLLHCATLWHIVSVSLPRLKVDFMSLRGIPLRATVGLIYFQPSIGVSLDNNLGCLRTSRSHKDRQRA
jgi:hypothetical protein